MNQVKPENIKKEDNIIIVKLGDDEEGYQKLSKFDQYLDIARKQRLFEDLGGVEGIESLAKRVYQYNTQDNRISEFFDYTMISRFENMLINFIIGLLGGKPYNKRSMIKAHRRIGGLTDAHFDAFVENLTMAMKHQNVPNNTIIQLNELVENAREDVTGLTEQERANIRHTLALNNEDITKCPFYAKPKEKGNEGRFKKGKLSKDDNCLIL